jgi:hypothetical protein
MQTKRIFLTLLALTANHCFTCAGESANISTNPAAEITGGHSRLGTNGPPFPVAPAEFWSGPWNEGTNGWRVQLRVFKDTSFTLRNGIRIPFSTNVYLSVEWGSPAKDSGEGYFQAPNGKFAKFELLDAEGNVVPPIPSAGRTALTKWGNVTRDPGWAINYGADQPEWLALDSGSLVGVFPETVTTNVYPRFTDTGQMAGEIRSFSNRPPTYISLFKLEDRIYCVPKEGDYTLTVQPVLYKQRRQPDDGILDRVDLPSVTTKVRLAPVTSIMGGFSVMRGTNGRSIFTNPSEFWTGVWQEDTNGWRVQLRINSETNYWDPQKGILVLRVEWGSAVRDSGDGYYRAPNGKFAKFQLLDAKGNVVPPNPNAGTNMLLGILQEHSLLDFGPRPTYGTRLPAWASPSIASLEAKFPKTASTDVYPRYPDGRIAGKIECSTNRPPVNVGFVKLDEIYSITNEGDYTLTIQPVLYKRGNQANDSTLERVDLPAVTTKLHLLPNSK